MPSQSQKGVGNMQYGDSRAGAGVGRGHALGGRFTTAEAQNPGVMGDAPGISNKGSEEFIGRLNEVLKSKRVVTIVLGDRAGNSYVRSLADDPGVPDDGLKITRYEHTFEHNEELGLDDIKTENYEP